MSSYTQLRSILSAQGGGYDYSFGDSRYTLVRKIGLNLGVDLGTGASEQALWYAIAVASGRGDRIDASDSIQEILSQMIDEPWEEEVILRYFSDNGVLTPGAEFVSPLRFGMIGGEQFSLIGGEEFRFI